MKQTLKGSSVMPRLPCGTSLVLRLIAGSLKACLPALAGLWLVIGPAQGGMERLIAEGEADYQDHCAACHGPAGEGDGPMAGSLAAPPGDLTRLEKNSGGAFPFDRVYAIILGDTPVPGHDTFQMPRFSERFRRDEAKPGYLPGYVRSLILTHYLQALQKK